MPGLFKELLSVAEEEQVTGSRRRGLEVQGPVSHRAWQVFLGVDDSPLGIAERRSGACYVSGLMLGIDDIQMKDTQLLP